MSIEKVEHPYCIIPVDDPVHPIEVNESYVELFGYTMDEYNSGKINFEELISKEDKLAVDTLWATENKDFYYLRHNMIKKDGTKVLVDAIATFFERDGKKYVRVSLSDYPRQKELADKSDSYRK